jgi:arylsulfatase A-like enzyme
VSLGIDRRDFLKLAGLAPLSLALSPLMRGHGASQGQTQGRPNVLILVFDALSALNLSLSGYGRVTMPNLERLAKRAIVYHNHYAASNFTSSGTASLLTGTLPWTHRAIEDNGKIAGPVVDRNIFRVFEDYHGIAFSHNSWAMTLLDQFRESLDELVPREMMYLATFDAPIHRAFYRDNDVADVAWARSVKLRDGYSYSLFLSRFYAVVREAALAGVPARFPRGVPMNESSDVFLLEQSTDWVGQHLRTTPQPFIGYFHFLPPHAPYRTSLEFFDRFAADGLRPADKPMAEFGTVEEQDYSLTARTQYDEFILYADWAFGELYDSLERSGVLDNTWLIVTSDHGEMFERGLVGHGNPTLYEPVIRVPLIIFEPGRESGMEIVTPSSSVDVLPTMAQVTGHAIPGWTEGLVLPPFAAEGAASDRGIYAVQARKSRQTAPLTRATITLLKGPYKIIYYMGYVELGVDEMVKVFDTLGDPEELVDLASTHPGLTADLLAELKISLVRSDAPYQA